MDKMNRKTREMLGGLVGMLLLIWPIQAGAQASPPALVEVAPVLQKTVSQPVTFVGTVEPSRRSLVASEVDGVVERVSVEEGQFVQQGENLLRLRQERFRIALRGSQAAAERYRQELAELKNGTRPEVIEEARAAVAEAEAELERASREKSRQMGLNTRGVGALQSREDAETAFQVARQRLTRTRTTYTLAVRGPRVERIAQAEAQYQGAQADIARLEYDLQHAQVKAPFAGFVITRHVEVGQWLGRDDPVVTLIELRQAYITIPIPERYISHVELGASGLVQFDALPDTSWDGQVIRIIPQAMASRTFPVTVAVDNPESQIKSGFFARVTLTVGEQQHALLVPKDAIVTQGPRQIVYTVRDGKATSVPIQRTSFFEGFAMVTGPLQPGDQVVVRGNERLRPGQAVQIVPVDTSG